ncbi:hypothetical protein FRC12_002425 [Ceratobasidium sp. 428]|nr:hypothetical protein FRC12_002425 [Ceratobasidium sp. 428]
MEWVGSQDRLGNHSALGRTFFAILSQSRAYNFREVGSYSDVYREGMQARDCSMDRAREVLDLLVSTTGTVLSDAVIPTSAVAPDGSLAEERSLLAMLIFNPGQPPSLLPFWPMHPRHPVTRSPAPPFPAYSFARHVSDVSRAGGNPASAQSERPD